MNLDWKYENIPTPKTDEDYKKLIDAVFNQRLRWIKDYPRWNKIEDRNDLTLREIYVNNSDFPIYCTSGILHNVNIDDIAKLFYNSEYEEKKVIFEDLISQEITNLKEIKNAHVINSKYSASFGVSNREILGVKAIRKYDTGGYFIVVQSINKESIPFSNLYVRAIAQCATVLRPINDDKDVEIININHIDPKGWIPSFLVTMFRNKQFTSIEKIQEIYGKK
jgi:hypothetical protein